MEIDETLIARLAAGSCESCSDLCIEASDEILSLNKRLANTRLALLAAWVEMGGLKFRKGIVSEKVIELATKYCQTSTSELQENESCVGE